MRSIKELLEYFNERAGDNDLSKGLCVALKRVKLRSDVLNNENSLSPIDYVRLIDYIEINKPNTFSSLSSFGQRLLNSNYFWLKGDYKSRRKWLKKHIKLNS